MIQTISKSIHHDIRSRWSYAIDEFTLHLKLCVEKDLVQRIEVVSFDPFNWAPDPKGRYRFVTDDFKFTEMHKEHSNEALDYWFVCLTDITEKRVRYGFILYTASGLFFFGPRGVVSYEDYQSIKFTGTGEGLGMFFNFSYLNQKDIYRAPDWVKSTVWYQIYPATFAHHEDPQTHSENGTIKGIIKALDYIVDLGFTGIYFTPIFMSPSTHKYDTVDYTTIDPAFGTNEDFKELVTEAHKRNIKVMLDGVFNHCSIQHPFFQDVINHSEASIYKDYFFIKSFPVINFDIVDGQPHQLTFEQTRNLNYDTFGFVAGMPKLNTDNPDLQKYILDVCQAWVRDYDIDGWRLDVSNEVSHDFWRSFRKAMKTVKSDIYIIGENWENSYPWLQGDQFDGVMNFELMYRIWSFLGKEPFVNRHMSVEQFVASLGEYFVMYPKPVYTHMFNFLDNHDTPRFFSVVNEHPGLFKIALVLLLSFPGSPSVFYGTEQLISGVDPGDSRKAMDWKASNLDMLNFLKNLIDLRKTHPSMQSIDYTFKHINSEQRSFLLIKNEEAESAYIYINAGQLPVTIDQVHLDPVSYHIDFEDKT